MTQHKLAIDQHLDEFMTILNFAYPYHPMADITGREPFKVLMCCLLTLRSRDVVTLPVCAKLFQQVSTPEALLAMPDEYLADLIRPVQFYQNKANILKSVSRDLMERFDGQVPNSLEALISIKWVGLKTANLVLQMAFHQDAIVVDTHVHRICNRLGYVQTKAPEQTEEVLRQKLPKRYWGVINRVMVRHGQEVCIAGQPRCDICPVEQYCMQVGVTPRRAKPPARQIHPIFVRPE